jgi:hypothetical protein
VELPNKDIAGLMLELCDIRSPVKMLTQPCPASVERASKKSWAIAATAVLSETKEYLGSKLVKHSSIQVRRLLAKHGTDEAALRELHDWALEKDTETLEHLVRRLDIDWLLTRLESGVRYPTRLLITIASRASYAGDASLDRVAALPAEISEPMLLTATHHIAANPSVRWNLPALLEGRTEGFCENVAAVLTNQYNGFVSESLLREALAHPVLSKHIKSHGLNIAAGFDIPASRMLIEMNPLYASGVIMSSWDPALFEDVLATNRLEVISTLLSDNERLRSLTPDQVDRAILAASTAEWKTSSYRPPSLNRQLLQQISHELSTDVLLAYLRCSEEFVTWQWLTGTYNQKPRPGEISRLAQDPGWSLGYTPLHGKNGTEFSPASPEEVARSISQKFEALVSKPWCDELVDSFGGEVFSYLVRSYSTEGRNYLVARITKELGSDPEVWRDALAHFGKSRLSVGKTLTAIRLLHTASSASRP